MIFATALVNWNAIWKIILAALIGGTGVVIVFGFLLLGISRGRTAKTSTERAALFTLSGICGVIVVAVAAIGIYAMTQKPTSKPTKSKSALAIPARSERELVASAP